MAKDTKKKGIIDRDEMLTDNTKLEKCRRCKTCRYRDNGDVWSNDYTKTYCAIFIYPDRKPGEVIHNGDCDFYERG